MSAFKTTPAAPKGASEKVYTGFLALAVAAFLSTPGLFLVLQVRHPFYVVMAPVYLVAMAALSIAVTFSLFIWFVRRRETLGTFATFVTLIIPTYTAVTDPTRATTAFLLGLAIPSAYMFWMRLRSRAFDWKTLAWGVLAWPAISAAAIVVTGGPTLFAVSTSHTTAAPGEEVSIVVTGILGVPAGTMSVYLFPDGRDAPKEGYEPPFFYAEMDSRITAGHSRIRFPLPQHSASFTAGNANSQCGGGDICNGASMPLLGDYTVAVGIPNPFYSWNTMLVVGPKIRIEESQAQREAALFEDEADFLYKQLCQAVKERSTTQWGFAFEQAYCGGFQGARPSIDPDTPVWNKERDRADTRAPLFVEEGNLCLVDTPTAYYTGKAKVCMPYAGDPLAPLPDAATVEVALEWSGGQMRFEGHSAREIIQKEIWTHASKLFPEDIHAGEAMLEHADNLVWHEAGETRSTTFAYQTATPTWIRASVDADFRVCLFAYKGERYGAHIPNFADPQNWKRCTVLLAEPTVTEDGQAHEAPKRVP